MHYEQSHNNSLIDYDYSKISSVKGNQEKNFDSNQRDEETAKKNIYLSRFLKKKGFQKERKDFRDN